MLALLLIGCGQLIIGAEATSWEHVITHSLDGALVVDARQPAAWEAGHVPGSAHVHWTELTGFDADGYWDLRATEELAFLLGERGISEADPLVILGGGVPGWGDDGNLYWTLRYLGHPDVRVYNGGFAEWVASGGTPVMDLDAPPPATFVPEIQEHLRASTEDVADWEGVIVDVRSEEEWRQGHVPGAVWVEWSEVYADEHALLPEAEVRSLMAGHGIEAEDSVVTYCQAGVRAGHTFLVLDAIGLPMVSNYVGSWARWTAEGGEVQLPGD